jgi:hypothetical protein
MVDGYEAVYRRLRRSVDASRVPIPPPVLPSVLR